MGATHTHTYTECMGYARLGEAKEENLPPIRFILERICSSCIAIVAVTKLLSSSSILHFLQRISASCIARTLIYVLRSAALPLVSFFRSRLIRFRAKKTQQQQLGVLSINILWQTCCCCWKQAGRKKKGDFSIKKFRHEITIACNKYLKYRIYQ